MGARQAIGGIGARNNADGIFFGTSAQLALAGFGLGGSVIHDRRSVDTSHGLFDGSEATSRYCLRGTTADIHAGYSIAGGGGRDVGPELGVTPESGKRGAASETGASVSI